MSHHSSKSFSIREYTVKKRAEDVFQCWPFPAGDATAEEIRSMLPPMPVRKFRWWKDELARVVGEEESPLAKASMDSMEEEMENRAVEVEMEMENLPVAVEEETENLAVVEEEELLENLPLEEMKNPNVEEKDEMENSPVMMLEKEIENPIVEKKQSENPEEEQRSEVACPVCKVYRAKTVSEANTHFESCLTQVMGKCSLSEIFNVTLEENEQEGEKEKDENNVEIKMKKNLLNDDVLLAMEGDADHRIEQNSENSSTKLQGNGSEKEHEEVFYDSVQNLQEPDSPVHGLVDSHILKSSCSLVSSSAKKQFPVTDEEIVNLGENNGTDACGDMIGNRQHHNFIGLSLNPSEELVNSMDASPRNVSAPIYPPRRESSELVSSIRGPNQPTMRLMGKDVVIGEFKRDDSHVDDEESKNSSGGNNDHVLSLCLHPPSSSIGGLPSWPLQDQHVPVSTSSDDVSDTTGKRSPALDFPDDLKGE